LSANRSHQLKRMTVMHKNFEKNKQTRNRILSLFYSKLKLFVDNAAFCRTSQRFNRSSGHSALPKSRIPSSRSHSQSKVQSPVTAQLQPQSQPSDSPVTATHSSVTAQSHPITSQSQPSHSPVTAQSQPSHSPSHSPVTAQYSPVTAR
jgi:hypothetical protein